MMQHRRGMICVMAGVGLAVAVSGCGPTFVHVKGKVTRGGKLVEIAKRQVVEMTFLQLDADGMPFNSYGASYNPTDGSYEVHGPKRKGIPVGKYKITFKKVALAAEVDLLEGRFDAKNSPFVRDITQSGEVNIDLDQK